MARSKVPGHPARARWRAGRRCGCRRSGNTNFRAWAPADKRRACGAGARFNPETSEGFLFKPPQRWKKRVGARVPRASMGGRASHQARAKPLNGPAAHLELSREIRASSRGSGRSARPPRHDFFEVLTGRQRISVRLSTIPSSPVTTLDARPQPPPGQRFHDSQRRGGKGTGAGLDIEQHEYLLQPSGGLRTFQPATVRVAGGLGRMFRLADR